jgi:hypothetical protein
MKEVTEPEMTKKEAWIGLLGYTRYLFFVILCFGTLALIRPVGVLIHYSDYKPETLKKDSSYSSSSDAGFTVYIVGKIGEITTEIGIQDYELGNDIFLRSPYEREHFYPIWFKPDGSYSVFRYPDEKVFPTQKYLNEIIKIAVFMFLPFIFSWLLHYYLKKKFLANKL